MKKEKLEIYMKMAHTIKKLSPDAETQVGSLMLSEDGRIIATSFNGFVRGADDSKLPKTRDAGKHDYVIHAERNMLYNCCHEGIKTKDTTVICTLSPCLACLRAMKTSGVTAVIFDELYNKFPDTDFYTKLGDMGVDISEIGEYTHLELYDGKW